MPWEIWTDQLRLIGLSNTSGTKLLVDVSTYVKVGQGGLGGNGILCTFVELSLMIINKFLQKVFGFGLKKNLGCKRRPAHFCFEFDFYPNSTH